jgi:hypothetical protein
MTNKETAQQIEELQRQIAELKGAVKATTAPDYEKMRREAAQWDDEMRQLAERRANYAVPPSVVRDWAVIPDKDVRGIVHDNQAPQGPSSQGIVPNSQQMSNVRGTGGPQGPSGWAHEVPIGPPPGVNYADRLMDAQDAKDRAELIRQDAQLKAAQKAMKR